MCRAIVTRGPTPIQEKIRRAFGALLKGSGNPRGSPNNALESPEWPDILYFALFVVLLTLGVCSAAVRLSLIPFRRSAGEHWTVRANKAFESHTVAALLVITFSIFIGGVGAACFLLIQGESVAGDFPLYAGSIVLTFFAAYVAVFPAIRETCPRPISTKGRIGSFLIILLLFWSHVVMVPVLYFVLPEQFGLLAVGIVAVFLAVGGWMSFRGAVLLLKTFGLMVPATPRMLGATERAAARLGVKVPAVYELRWHIANAFALQLSGAVAYTTAAADVMTDDQLESIAVHEMSHMVESTEMKFGRLMCGLSVILLAPILKYTSGFFSFFCPLVFVFLLVLFNRRIGRRGEVSADRAAHQMQADEGAYATALCRLYEANRSPAVMSSNLHAHPHLYDRMVAAGVQPDFPRPKPPTRWRAQLIVVSAIVVAFLVLVFATAGLLLSGVRQYVPPHLDDEQFDDSELPVMYPAPPTLAGRRIIDLAETNELPFFELPPLSPGSAEAFDTPNVLHQSNATRVSLSATQH